MFRGCVLLTDSSSLEIVLNRYARTSVAWGLLGGLLMGCSTEAEPPKVAVSTVIEDAGPGVVELSNAVARMTDDNVIRFEIPYKFVSGSLKKFFVCEIEFPGTTDKGVKQIDSWDIAQEGIVTTGIQVSSPDVKTFSITMSEAESPDQGFKVISNTLTGEVQPKLETK